jgi:CubicO group peptidase (beta-lactamase class C family)
MLLLSLFLANIQIAAQSSNQTVTNKEIEQKADEYLQALTDMGKFNGVALIAREGIPIIDKAYNADKNSPGLEVSTNSCFIIASVSKLFTRLAIYQLEEKGKLSTNDKLSKYIPDFPEGDKITIQQIIDMKSGIARESGAPMFEEISFESVIDSIKSKDVRYEPGSEKLYSNAGYTVLAWIIQEVSGMNFEDYMQKKVFKPLGMNSTHFYHPGNKEKELVKGFMKEEGFTELEEVLVNSYGCGQDISNSGDLFRFSQQLNGTDDISKSIVEKMKGGKESISWTGGNIGYSTRFKQMYQPEITIIVLSNIHAAPVSQISKDIEAIILGQEYEVPKAIYRESIAVSEDILQHYVGTFQLEMDQSMSFRFFVEDGKLFFVQIINGEEQPKEDKTEVYAESENTFFLDPTSEDSIIFRKEDGQIIMFMTFQGMELKALPVE